MKLDRKKAPKTKSIEGIKFPEIEKYQLKNGIPVYLMDAGTQEIIKIDLIIEAGQWFSENTITPILCNRMLIEGSKKFNHQEIAEKLDYYGTFSNLECGRHFSQIQLFTLSNFFDKSIEILEDFIKYPTFPEDKLKVLVQNELQQFVVSQEKTDVLAANEFVPRIFGANHPYGKVRKLADYENIDLEQIKLFHKRYYNASNCTIMVSGKLNPDVKQVLESNFGNNDWTAIRANSNQHAFESTPAGRFLVHKQGAVQSTVMIGKRTINKNHPDYFGLSILNTVLGGYFGSRLMTNLREKNALTYGVYSSLSSLLHSGSFTVSANVNSNLVEKAIKQIYKEIELLQNKDIPDEELQMVKNYLAGDMLRAFDGPMAISEIFLDIIPYGHHLDYYQKYFEILKSIKPNKLKELANQYLDKNSFVEVIAGNLDK